MGFLARIESIDLQDRDLAFLVGLMESRVLTLAHASALYFAGHAEAAKKRVQKLKAAGLVGERPRRPYEPSVLFVTRKALQYLRDGGHLSEFPQVGLVALEKRSKVSESTLRHELLVMDVRAAISVAAQSTPALRMAEFLTWPLLFQFYACPGPNLPEVLVKPDGYLRIEEQSLEGECFEHTFFLEVDRSTETHDVIAAKAMAYVDYYRRGGLAVRRGDTSDAYKEHPFRVLLVTRTAERRDNLARRLLANEIPIRTQVWLATATDLVADPLGPVWAKPVDYAPGAAPAQRCRLLSD